VWYRDKPEDKESCNLAERELIRTGPGGTQTTGENISHPPLPWSCLLKSGNAWALGLTMFFVSFGWYFYPTWQPEYLKNVFHISYEDSPILTGLPFLCGAFGCLAGGKISDLLVHLTGSRRWGRSLVGLVAFTGAGSCVFATGFVTTAWHAVAFLCAASFINDLAIPVVWAACSDIGGRHSGTVSGFMNSIGLLGGILSPTITPLLREHLTWRAVFVVLASSWFAGALCWLRIAASKPLIVEPD